VTTAFYMEPATLQRILEILISRGCTIIGPTVQASAVVLDEVESLDSLPWGWRDRQAPGVYAVSRTADTGFFQYTCGPHSWKRYLYPPNMRLFSVSLEDGGIQLEQTGRPDLSYAFLGMRACDLKALAVLDRVLAEQGCPDPDYQALRRNLFIIAVNCLQPGGTCFCAAMGAGPRPVSGYDIVLHEICEPARYRLIAESGSPRGADLLSAVGCMPASMAAKVHVQLLSDAAAKKMKTTADLSDAGSLFGSRFDHPHWKTLEQRCLACGNCTLVCPTCFCHTVGETEFVEEGRAQRHRQWDSCFSKTFSYMHGGSIRTSIASRYRQWLCHKLSTWQEQFGTPGCVGCGRCRTWCPAGIDLLEEVRMLAKYETT
jgi:sulfhydrogenase subunit beta (sulfur reductase)